MAKRAKGISDFYNTNKKSFARPSLFQAIISKANGSPAPDILTVNCFQATVPGLSIATTDKDKAYRSTAYQKIYEDIELGFYCGNDMEELQFLQGWMNEIINPADNHVAYYENYAEKNQIDIINLSTKGPNVSGDVIKKTGDAAIEQIGLQTGSMLLDAAGNEKILVTSIMEAFPKQISTLPMDFGTTNDILRVTATFTYRYYTQEFVANKPKELSAIDRNMKFLAKNLRHLGKKGIPLDNGLIHTLSKQERFDKYDGENNPVEYTFDDTGEMDGP